MKRFVNKRDRFPLWGILFTVILFSAVGCLPQKRGTNDAADLIADGDEALTSQDWGKAIDCYSQALEKDPKNVAACYGRSGAHLAKGKEFYLLTEAAAGQQEFDKARETAVKADEEFAAASADARGILEIETDNADAHYILGCIAVYQADWNGAVESFSEVIRLRPDDPAAYQRRGEVYGHMNDSDNESADLKRAAELGYSSEFIEEVSESDEDEAVDEPTTD